MVVFVIPVRPDRNELYYEHTSDAEVDEEAPPNGILARLQRRFSDLLRAAEEHRHHRNDAADADRSWLGRMQDRLLSWMAERIVEQRLLWMLRKQAQVVAVHPSDLGFDLVLQDIQQELQRDYERHRFWLVIDTIGLVVSWPLTVIPGPNVLLFYFMFRVGGHWFSLRGAAQGRSRVTWTSQPCDALVELRGVINLKRRERQERVRAIAEKLQLRHLPRFIERARRAAKTAKTGKGH